jgi:6-phosphogluconolactonase
MAEHITVTIVEDDAALATQGAEMFVRCVREAMDKRGASFVAVSGGATPRAMHRLLAEPPYQKKISWQDLHLYWVDDRCVPYSDPASNFGMAREDFIEKVPLQKKQVHAMPTEMAPEDGALQYHEEVALVPMAPSGYPRFDAVFLGIGSDGHTASLFPGHTALEKEGHWIVAVKGGDPDVYRLTMTLPVLNQARHIVFLASGEKKASIVKAVLEDKQKIFPAERILPVDGHLTWLVNRAAGSLLSTV